MPDAALALVATVKRMFGVDARLLLAVRIPCELAFDGALGNNTAFEIRSSFQGVKNDVETRAQRLRAEAAAAGFPESGIEVAPCSVPDAAPALVAAVKRRFGVDARPAQTNGLEQALDFVAGRWGGKPRKRLNFTLAFLILAI